MLKVKREPILGATSPTDIVQDNGAGRNTHLGEIVLDNNTSICQTAVPGTNPGESETELSQANENYDTSVLSKTEPLRVSACPTSRHEILTPDLIEYYEREGTRLDTAGAALQNAAWDSPQEWAEEYALAGLLCRERARVLWAIPEVEAARLERLQQNITEMFNGRL